MLESFRSGTRTIATLVTLCLKCREQPSSTTLGIVAGSGQDNVSSLLLLQIGGDRKGFLNSPGAHFFEVLARNFKPTGLFKKWQLTNALTTFVTSLIGFLPDSVRSQLLVTHSGSYTENIFGSSLNRRVRNVVPERSSPKITKLRLFSVCVVRWRSRFDSGLGIVDCDHPPAEDGFAASTVDRRISSERVREGSPEQIEQEHDCLSMLFPCSSWTRDWWTKCWLFRIRNVVKAPIINRTARKNRNRKRNRIIVDSLASVKPEMCNKHYRLIT